MQWGREDGLLVRPSPEAPEPLSCLPASHPHRDAQRERGVGGRQMGHRERSREGLTCGQGWTPEGQEKQQPGPGHGPFDRRQVTAADLRRGPGEQAPTRLPPRPQAQLHLSCSTAEPFPSRGAPPTPPGPPNPILSHGPGNSGCHSHSRSWVPTLPHVWSTAPSLALPAGGHRARGSMSKASYTALHPTPLTTVSSMSQVRRPRLREIE